MSRRTRRSGDITVITTSSNQVTRKEEGGEKVISKGQEEAGKDTLRWQARQGFEHIPSSHFQTSLRTSSYWFRPLLQDLQALESFLKIHSSFPRTILSKLVALQLVPGVEITSLCDIHTVLKRTRITFSDPPRDCSTTQSSSKADRHYFMS